MGYIAALSRRRTGFKSQLGYQIIIRRKTMKLFSDTRTVLEDCKRLLRAIKTDNLNHVAEVKIVSAKIDTIITRLSRAIDN